MLQKPSSSALFLEPTDQESISLASFQACALTLAQTASTRIQIFQAMAGEADRTMPAAFAHHHVKASSH